MSATALAGPGAIDTNFVPAPFYAGAMAVQRDGRIICTGDVIQPYKVSRFKADGSLDTSFNAGAGANEWIKSVVLQSDGRLVIAGWFTKFSGLPRGRIARLETNGTIDPSFVASADDDVLGALVQPDDKILVAGQFTSVNGVPRPRIARLNADGSLDGSFNPPATTDVWFDDLTLQLDGRIVAVGSRHDDWRYGPYIARFQMNGTLDFGVEPWQNGYTPFRSALCVVVQSDGRIVVGGNFTDFFGLPLSNIARLNPDGSPDNTFRPGGAANDWVLSLAVQGDDKIYAAGYFTSYDGIARSRLARLKADGSLDAAFDSVRGADNTVSALALQEDGSLLVGGVFNSFNNEARYGLARLLGDPPGAPVLSVQPNNQTVDAGQDMSFTVAVSSFKPVSYQWLLNEQPLPGRIFSLLRLTNALPADAGKYSVVASNLFGAVTSAVATLTVATSAPLIIAPPASLTVDVEQLAEFSVTVTGIPQPHLQWQFNGTSLEGEEYPSLTRYPAQTTDAGLYTVVVSNIVGVVTSAPATLIVRTYAPIFTSQPVSQTAAVGRTIVFSAGVAAAPPAEYQWRFNGANIAGATAPELTLVNVRFTNAGAYSLAAGNSQGVTESDAAALAVSAAPTGPGEVDVGFYPGTGANEPVNAIALQRDGKLLLAGDFSEAAGLARNRIARLNADGSVDTTFDAGSGPDRTVSALLVQRDGKILIGGAFRRVNGTPRSYIARLNPDSSLDESFSAEGSLAQTVNALALGPDGNILAAVSVPEGAIAPIVVQLNSEGGSDGSFNTLLIKNNDGGTSGRYPIPTYALTMDHEGKLMIGWDFGLLRFLPAGAKDLTFERPWPFAPVSYFVVRCAAVQHDGRILVGGSFMNRGFSVAAVARINPNASVDASFAPNLLPVGISFSVNAIQIQPDGKVLIAGSFTDINGMPRSGLARLRPDGSVDLNFAADVVGSGAISSMVLRPDGRIIVAGSFTSVGGVPRRGIAQLHGDSQTAPVIVTPPASQIVLEGQSAALFVEASGSPLLSFQWQINGTNLDGAANARLAFPAAIPSYAGRYTVIVSNTLGSVTSAVATITINPAPTHPGALAGEPLPEFGANGSVLALTTQKDGRFLIGGLFTSVQGVPRNRIARLHGDGSVDLSFDPGSGVTGVGSASVNALALQEDGKVLVGGAFKAINGFGRTNVARVNVNGTVDNSFDAGLGPDRAVYALLPQRDGRVLIAGEFSSVGPQSRRGVARLNADGSLDAGFTPVQGGMWGYSLVQQSSGKIVVGGVNAGFTSQGMLGFIASNGVWNLSANIVANAPIYAMAVLPDDSLLVGGAFTKMGALTRNGVARLNPNGVVLSNVWPSVAVSGAVRTMLRLNCAKVVLGGSFTNVNGVRHVGLARLNPDGSLDEDYSAGTSTDGTVFALAQQSDGRIVAGGEFSRINASPRPCLARLTADPFTLPMVVMPAPGQPVQGGTNVTLSVDAGCWPQSAFQWQFKGTNLPSGTNASLLIPYFRFVNAGDYSVAISNALGQATSPPVTVGVNEPAAPGALDLDFIPSALMTKPIHALALYQDGRILAAFLTNDSSGFTWSKVVRLSADGRLDSAFVPINLQGELRALAVDDDGKVLIGGVISGGFKQWNADGASTPGSILGLPSDLRVESVQALAFDSDGRILIGGEFSSPPGFRRNGVARLLSSGLLDTNFVVGSGANNLVYTLARQSDGRILVAGAFTSFDGGPRKLIARLKTDGSLDPSFDVSSNVNAIGPIRYIGIQVDGKILVGGQIQFESAGIYRRRVVRLNVDGTIDWSFDSGLGLSATVNGMAVQPDNHVLLAGVFPCGGNSTCRVIRLGEDGTTDPTFDAAPGPDEAVTTLIRQKDGRVLLAGSFKNVNGVPRNRIARLLGNIFLFDPSVLNGRSSASIATVAGKTYTLESKDSLAEATWTPRTNRFGDGSVQVLADPAPNPSHRFYRIRVE